MKKSWEEKDERIKKHEMRQKDGKMGTSFDPVSYLRVRDRIGSLLKQHVNIGKLLNYRDQIETMRDVWDLKYS
jgi:hypothetical protein